MRVNHPGLQNKYVFRWRQKTACVWMFLMWVVSSNQQVLQQQMSRHRGVFWSVVRWNYRVLMIGDGGRCTGCTSRSSTRAPFRGKRRTSGCMTSSNRLFQTRGPDPSVAEFGAAPCCLPHPQLKHFCSCPTNSIKKPNKKPDAHHHVPWTHRCVPLGHATSPFPTECHRC